MQRIKSRYLLVTLLISSAALSGCGNSEEALLDGKNTGAPQKRSVSIDPSYQSGSKAVDQAEDKKNNSNEKEVKEIDGTPLLREAAMMATEEGQPRAAAENWMKVYEKNPSDPNIAFEYARSMRYLGVNDKAEQILRDALQLYPTNSLLRLELAKVRLATGDAKGSLNITKGLDSENPNDPGILQVMAIAMDREKQDKAAQEVYERAIRIGTPSASLLNNAGLSYAMSGDIKRAEELLRQAIVSRGANVQVKQNLALILSLKGDHEAARRYAQEALPPNVAEQTLAYFSSLSDQRDAWNSMKLK